MEVIDLYRHLKTVIADLQRLQEIDRDPSIFTVQEGRERLEGAIEKCTGLAEVLRRGLSLERAMQPGLLRLPTRGQGMAAPTPTP